MEPVALPELAADPEPRFVEIAKNQPEYITLPALVYNDGTVLTEWQLTQEEIGLLQRGERLRLWITVHPQVCPSCQSLQPARLQPVRLNVTSEENP